jgi:hypothetical protein
MLYRLTSSYFCCGFVTKDSIVIDAAPIIKWMKGKTLIQVYNWCIKKSIKFEKLK